MIHAKYKQERQRQTLRVEREELQQATRRFVRSLLRTGGSVALLPVTRLPRESQRHFLAASREFNRGWATLIYEFAHGIEEMAKEASTPTHRVADEELEESQQT